MQAKKVHEKCTNAPLFLGHSFLRNSLMLRWSGRRDLNSRPSEPHSDALARLRYAPDHEWLRGDGTGVTVGDGPRVSTPKKGLEHPNDDSGGVVQLGCVSGEIFDRAVERLDHDLSRLA